MSLIIQVEDFKGEIISKFHDKDNDLKDILDYCYLNPSLTKTFKYIDLYDNTVFNSLQIKDFIKDLEFLNEKSFFEKSNKLLSELIKLSKIALTEPHLYLIFDGD